jgi:soluble lytic murein transglycosylase
MKKKGLKARHFKKNLLILFILLFAISFLLQAPIVQKIFYPYPYREIIEKYSAEYGVDPLLVIAVIRAESKFLPQSKSHKGAQGLMQLMPNTAKFIAESIGDKEFKETDLVEPEKNIQYGTWYLASLQKEFKSITLVLAAYNGGRGHVNEWIKTAQLDLTNLRVDDIPFEETREYVQRVLQYYTKYINLYRT